MIKLGNRITHGCFKDEELYYNKLRSAFVVLLITLALSSTIFILPTSATGSDGDSYIQSVISRIAQNFEEKGFHELAASWSGSVAGAPLLVYSEESPLYYLVPIIKNNQCIAEMGTDINTGDWMWYSETYQYGTFPPVSAQDAKSAAEGYIKNQSLEGILEIPQLNVMSDNGLYWVFPLVTSGSLETRIYVSFTSAEDVFTERTISKTIATSRNGYGESIDSKGLLSNNSSLSGTGSSINVPYHAQLTGYYCGSASLEMAMDYYGPDISQYQIANVARSNSSYGAYADDIRRAAHFSNLSTSVGVDSPGNNCTGYTGRDTGYGAFEYSSNSYWLDSLKNLVDQGYAIEILTWYDTSHSSGHFRVVTSYDSSMNSITVNDPWNPSWGGLYGGPNVVFSNSTFQDLWRYSSYWALFTHPWTVTLNAPSSVQKTSTFSVSATVTYSCPSPFTTEAWDLYPAASAKATITLPANLLLATGETATKNIGSGELAAGSSATISWQVVAGNNTGFYDILVNAYGNVSGNLPWRGGYPAYSYTDRIGGVGTKNIDVGSDIVTFETNPTTFAGSSGTITLGNYTYSNGQTGFYSDDNYLASANAPTNYQFDHWAYSGSLGNGVYVENISSNPTTVQVQGDGWLKAIYRAKITLQTNTLSGSLTWNSLTYTNGQTRWETNLPPDYSSVATIAANPPAGYRFISWSTAGMISVTNSYSNPASLIINGAGSVMANFADLTPPSTPNPDDGIAGWTNINNTSFSWPPCVDDGSGFAGYYWKVDSGPETRQVSTSVNLINQSDGIHTFYVKAVDYAGNSGAYGSHIFEIDATNPSGSLTINSGSQFTNISSVVLSPSSSDATSGVAGVCFSNDGLVWSSWESASPTRIWTLISGDGYRTVYFRIKDNAGLISSTYSANITVDSTPPEGSVKINNGELFTITAGIQLNLSANDASSGVAQMRFSNDNIVWSNWENYSQSKTWSLQKGDGNKTVFVQYKDNAGLISTCTATVALDTTSPQGYIQINEGATYSTSVSIMLNLLTTDVTSGIRQIRFSNDNTSWSNWENSAATKLWNLSSGDGDKTVFCQVSDNAGNTAILYTNVTLDTTYPTGSISINNSSPYLSNLSAILSLFYNDAYGISGVCYSNDGSVWSSWENASPTKAWTLISGDGSKTVYYRIKDNAGLISSTYSANIVVDTTPPQGSIKINNGTLFTIAANVQLNLSASDALSGVFQMRFSNDNAVWSNWENYSQSKTWNLQTGDGNKTLYVQYEDYAGLISTYKASITIDTTPPIAIAGQDQTIMQGNSVIFNGGESTDNTGVISYTWDFGDISQSTGITTTHVYSTPGTYMAKLTVQDTAGNTATATVNIVVQPQPTPTPAPPSPTTNPTTSLTATPNPTPTPSIPEYPALIPIIAFATAILVLAALRKEHTRPMRT